MYTQAAYNKLDATEGTAYEATYNEGATSEKQVGTQQPRRLKAIGRVPEVGPELEGVLRSHCSERRSPRARRSCLAIGASEVGGRENGR